MVRRVFRTKQMNGKAGTATVEAALVLPMVMMAILAVLSIIRITGTYSRMQHALNQVAEDMSQYSYLYAISGLKQQHDTLVDNISSAQDQFLEQQEAVGTFYQSIQSVAGDVSGFGDSGDFNVFFQTLDDLGNVDNSFDALSEQVETILEDPMGELRLIGLSLSGPLVNKTKTALLGFIAKSMMKSRLSNDLSIPAKDLDQRLRLTDGVQSLDFSCSTFFEDKKTIDLILEYSVKPMPDFFFLPEIRLRNRACVLAWTWGVDRQEQPIPEGESIWNYGENSSYFKQNSARGISAEDRYAQELAKKLGKHSEATPYFFPVVDVIEYAHDRQPGKLITVFTLNPFLNSYQAKGPVYYAINSKMRELKEFTTATKKDYTINVSGGNYERIVYLIIPENEEMPEFFQPDFERAQQEAKKLGVELHLLKKYGEYTKPYQDSQEESSKKE
ncbi:MAG: pilus assembly protein [Thermoclostridium sp.]|nr:pilus assembly protein [Thermoclostridium sp.]